MGKDGTFTYGNDYIKAGNTADGKLVLDLKIPTGAKTSYTTRLMLDTEPIMDLINDVVKKMSGSSSSTAPPPILTPPPVLIP